MIANFPVDMSNVVRRERDRLDQVIWNAELRITERAIWKLKKKKNEPLNNGS